MRIIHTIIFMITLQQHNDFKEYNENYTYKIKMILKECLEQKKKKAKTIFN